MKKTNINIAFVYHYWNINNLMSYYGYKEDWDKEKYSPFDIFVIHPLGEKSTRNHYCGSIKQERWKEACKKGEIYGEIIAVFTGENSGKLAHEYEHQMIITHKSLYGQDTLYNKNDGYKHFSTAGTKCPHDEKWCKQHSKQLKEKYGYDDWKKFWSKILTEIGNRPEVREKRRQNSLGEKNSMFSVHRYGEKAPNYGRTFINNGILCKSVKKEDLNQYLNNGWEQGRLKRNENRKWINNGKNSKRVKSNELEKYLNNGWKLGRI